MSDPFDLEQWRRDLRGTLATLDVGGDATNGLSVPLPPADLIRRVNAPDKADPLIFLQTGALDMLALVDALTDVTPSLSPRPAVMELGCGVGRLLRHLPRAAFARTVATDVNHDCLDWCRQHLGGVECVHHGPRPPIDTLQATAFDLIYANSVFTHIPLERQQAWLREVERLLKPGGWLVVTVLGREHRDRLLDVDQRARLASEGAMQIQAEMVDDLDGLPVAYGAVFQTPRNLESSFGGIFDLCALRERPGSQDVLVARRRPGSSLD